MTSLTYDLSDIFNETGYINDKRDCGKYMYNHIVTHIILIQSNDSPIKIGDNFLYCYSNLISVDTSKIVNVIEIGDDFLGHCYELTIFDATKLTSLTTIGNGFLVHCEKLINFNTTGLSSLTTIGNRFLYGCFKLTITIKNPSNCLHNELLKTTYTIIQLYNIPVIHLDNNCVI